MHNKKNSTLPRMEKFISYPLLHGIPVDASIYELIQKMHPNNTNRFQNVDSDFIWMLGQFTKYTMRLNNKFKEKLQEWKNEANFNHGHPTVG
jgi:hypothetical protein